MNQKGFATLEIILMVMVVGILATMAVPQFEKVTAQANTAKVQSDLAAINSAVAIYQMEKGAVPAYNDIANSTYFENGAPQAPTGKVYIDGTITAVGSSTYGIDSAGKATFADKTAEHFNSKKSNS